jgi:hypothetical protein
MTNSSELFVKISHNIVENPKIVTLSCEARWAYLESIVYAARNFTDGLIDRRILHQRWSDSVIKELTTNDENPSWIMLDNGDVQIYAFCDWQMTAEKRKEIQEKKRNAGIKSGEARRQTNTTRTGVQQVFEQNANKKELELEVEQEKIKPLAIASPLFDEFWQLWPRREGKANAVKAWQKATKKITESDLLEKARAYVTSPTLPQAQFVPHAATWLNGERYNDEPQVHKMSESEWHEHLWRTPQPKFGEARYE